MKGKNYILALAIAAGTGICAFGYTQYATSPDEYCAEMQDGKLIITYEGSAITSDVTLENGTILRTDGTLVKKDGTKIALKDGECIKAVNEKEEEPKQKFEDNPK